MIASKTPFILTVNAVSLSPDGVSHQDNPNLDIDGYDVALC